MRILIVTSTCLPTVNGVSTHIETLNNNLQNYGHQVTICCPKHKLRKKQKNIVELPSVFNPFNTDYPLTLSWFVPKAIKQSEYDIIHLHHPFGVRRLAEKIAKRNRSPLVFTNHTQYLEYSKYYLPVLSWFSALFIRKSLRRLYKIVNLVICSTKEVENGVKSIFEKAKTKIVPVSINEDELNEKVKIDIRQKYGIKKDDFVFTYLGRIAEEKNIPGLLAAFKAAKAENPGSYLLLIGPGDYLKKMSPQDGVIIAGKIPQNQVYSYLSQSDLFVSASTSETLGLVFAEAAYCGLPLLGINSAGVQDIIKDGTNGFLERDFEAFKQRMIKAPELSAEIRALRPNCKDSVSDFLTATNIEKLIGTYSQLVE